MRRCAGSIRLRRTGDLLNEDCYVPGTGTELCRCVDFVQKPAINLVPFVNILDYRAAVGYLIYALVKKAFCGKSAA